MFPQVQGNPAALMMQQFLMADMAAQDPYAKASLQKFEDDGREKRARATQTEASVLEFVLGKADSKKKSSKASRKLWHQMGSNIVASSMPRTS